MESSKYVFEDNLYKLETQSSTKVFLNNVATAMSDERIMADINRYHKYVLYYIFIKIA